MEEMMECGRTKKRGGFVGSPRSKRGWERNKKEKEKEGF